jgi:disulfide bond formation protein DsbB
MSAQRWFTFFALLTVGADIATISLWVLAALSRTSDAANERWQFVRAVLGDVGIPIAALVASVAMAGSLYLSEGAHLVPCKMCWYQRSAMYPLAVILVVAAFRRDWGVRPYAVTLGVAGSCISIYHYLIERFPSLEVGSGGCDPTNPCTITLIWKFHYISIPLMALSAFALCVTLLCCGRGPEPLEPEPLDWVAARDDEG